MDSSWNARPYITGTNLTTFPVKHIVIRQLRDFNSSIHQSNYIKTTTDLQDGQMDERRWADIGYSFFICGDNNDAQQVYRGRGWKYVGAHCLGYNFKSLGIGIIRNYTNIKCLNAFKSLIQCGITQNDIVKNFTLVGDLESIDIYEYYLKYFKNNTDL
ncbi:unnamed protein product [Didymodactylos carnosus]|uniref:Peptidoglycan recognition protein family domain-containing protein n=1 Tax=Didymodactylos carnosus TaxID=1234261 RepID=A0A815B6R6_9BILA|nr:unnamed protein product [Didymodactylos carnosus]CAF1267077.1 unnamed protein product [Didymodactylos carnosus]CAF3517012.1 unnamed protein product [Didymodactylos carnosus]CAF4051237.1 unnamed protein product [Didymodactylos carnosus]